jgi:cyclopropane-fatty-acyl-phospholipid synthase
MGLLEAAIRAVEATPLPDPVTRMGVEFLVGRTRRKLAVAPPSDRDFARGMTNYPVAEHTDLANEQHYELPPAFFGLTLGPRRKYSCCLYPTGTETLAQAELLALEERSRMPILSTGRRYWSLAAAGAR